MNESVSIRLILSQVLTVIEMILNYVLARIIVITEPSVDKNAFNDEIGAMMGWSFPVISVPCMLVSAYAFWLLVGGIKKFTGLSLEEVLYKAKD